MVFLVLDTAFETCRVGIAQTNGKIIAEHSLSGAQHDRALASMTDTLLSENNITIKDVEKIIVTTGPGRFTGLRVGIAFARGLALVHQTPITGILTTDAIARDLTQKYPEAKNKAVIVTVKRGESFVELFAPLSGGIEAFADTDLAAHIGSNKDIIIGGVLSPSVYNLLKNEGFKITEEVIGPSLASIAALGADQPPMSAVRPYYAHNTGT